MLGGIARMNLRVILALIGIVVALVSGILLGLRGASIVLQLCLVFGFSTGFIAIGCEHFYRESPVLSRYRSRAASVVVGCVLITVGVGLLALVASNLVTRGVR
jgi:hypothetical protein